MSDFNLKGLEGSEIYDKINSVFSTVMDQIPEQDRIDIKRKNIVVVLGDKATSYCIPLYFFQESNIIHDPIEVHIVALSSGIIDRSISDATYTIAHEVAHAYLGHGQHAGDPSAARNYEMDADRQVIKWGFEKELRACPDNYLFGNGTNNVFSS